MEIMATGRNLVVGLVPSQPQDRWLPTGSVLGMEITGHQAKPGFGLSMPDPFSERRSAPSMWGAPMDDVFLLSFSTRHISVENSLTLQLQGFFFLELSVILDQGQNLSKATFIKKRAFRLWCWLHREYVPEFGSRCCQEFGSWSYTETKGLDRKSEFHMSHRQWHHNAPASLTNFLNTRHIMQRPYSSQEKLRLSCSWNALTKSRPHMSTAMPSALRASHHPLLALGDWW